MDLSYLSDHYARQYRKNQKTKTSARTLPFRFSLRDQGRLLLVEDQGSLSTCWAITGIEGAAQTLYDQEHGLQLSSLHAAWYTLTGKEEEILQMNGDPYGNGGSSSLLAPSLAAWKGPIREEKLPMSDFDRIPDESMRYEADFHLQDAFCLPTSAYEDPDRNTVDQQIIKQVVYDYGPAVINVNVGNYSGYIEETNAWDNEPGHLTDHVVQIIGWNDSFSRENFNESAQPEHDGAWLVQNSWGYDWGENGTHWLSYEDSAISFVTVFLLE